MKKDRNEAMRDLMELDVQIARLELRKAHLKKKLHEDIMLERSFKNL